MKLNHKAFGAIEAILFIVLFLGLAVVGYSVYKTNQDNKQVDSLKVSQASSVKTATVTNFTECEKAAGSITQESFPETCVTKAGKSFTDTQSAKGTITGSLGYPSESNPAQKICAMVVSSTSEATCSTTADGQNSYTLSVDAGNYYVYASVVTAHGDLTPSYKAYYDEFSKCGNSASCDKSGHTNYLSVTVTAGQTVSDIDPTDWYNNQ